MGGVGSGGARRRSGPKPKDGPRDARGRLIRPTKTSACACGGTMHQKASMCLACYRVKKAADKAAALTCACGAPKTYTASRCVSCERLSRQYVQSCAHCGGPFQRARQVYCSKKCAGAAERARTAERIKAERAAREARPCAYCKDPMGEAKGTRHQKCRQAHDLVIKREYHRLHAERYRIKHGYGAPRQCRVCGATFTPPVRQGQHALCSAACVATSASRIRRANQAMRRKAARYGERFDPFDVFERDGWRCAICGIDTPRALRGSIAPAAPELDHIVPLACGGEHTRANTQCACRACNGAKGAREQWPGGGGGVKSLTPTASSAATQSLSSPHGSPTFWILQPFGL
jgi:hypothetical protein